MGVETCCRECCYSTPYVTLGALSVTTLGLIGYTISGVYGLSVMDRVPHLQNGTVLMAPVIVGSVTLTLIPLIFSAVLAYCITGYIRDVLFHKVTKHCITPAYSVIMMILTFLCVLLWVLLAMGFAGIMVYYVQAEIFCAGLEQGNFSPEDCFHYVDTSFANFGICGSGGLEEFCVDGLKVGLAFSICLLFTVFVVSGLVFLLVLQTSNFVSARDNFEYRATNSPQNYFSKQDR